MAARTACRERIRLMRKMYFAMIPKGNALGQLLTVAAVGVGGWYAYKYLTGEKELTGFTTKVKDVFFDKDAQEEEDLVTRIRRATKKGVDKLIK